MGYREQSLKKHYEWGGKIEVKSRVKVKDKEDLSLAYTPGVAEPCLEINADYEKSWALTRRSNLVAVITDGTAVLGLGDIGPEAAMPVMEGKCVLFKEFADVDAFPICVRSKDVDEIVRTVFLISGSFGGINLEDISAPRCFEIERRLSEICDIPVFHDDQHGTAIVLAAALMNALKLARKDICDARIVINGAGSAGIAIAEHLLTLGARNILLVDKFGIITDGDESLSEVHARMAKRTNPEKIKGTLSDAIAGADVFIGVSAPGVLTEDMVRSMSERSIVLPMANPTPEIMPEAALGAGAYIVGTGRSDFKNQINNVLAFPGIFKGALSVGATKINSEMKMAATLAIASLVGEEELTPDYVIPSPFDKRVAQAVADAVAAAALRTGEVRE